jgi:hypothetical protein
LFAYGFWPVELLVAAAVIFLVLDAGRTKPDGAVARSLRHRDRFWFAALILFVPPVAWRYFWMALFSGHAARGPGVWLPAINLIRMLLNGVEFGLAAGWIASPAKKEDRFNYWMTLLVAGALVIMTSIVVMATRPFRFTWSLELQVILGAAAIVGYLVSRVFAAKKPRGESESMAAIEVNPDEVVPMQPNPASALVWLMVGLAPIPILLMFVSSNSSNAPNQTWAPVVLIVCGLCNLCGGLGCLGRIKNMGVRVVLGIFLGIFFFLLSWLIALFEACSHSGGI